MQLRCTGRVGCLQHNSKKILTLTPGLLSKNSHTSGPPSTCFHMLNICQPTRCKRHVASDVSMVMVSGIVAGLRRHHRRPLGELLPWRQPVLLGGARGIFAHCQGEEGWMTRMGLRVVRVASQVWWKKSGRHILKKLLGPSPRMRNKNKGNVAMAVTAHVL